MMQRLLEASNANAFIMIREPQATNEKYAGSSRRVPPSDIPTPEIIDRDLMEEVMECWNHSPLLHLKLAAYHSDRIREGNAMPIEFLPGWN